MRGGSKAHGARRAVGVRRERGGSAAGERGGSAVGARWWVRDGWGARRAQGGCKANGAQREVGARLGRGRGLRFGGSAGLGFGGSGAGSALGARVRQRVGVEG